MKLWELEDGKVYDASEYQHCAVFSGKDLKHILRNKTFEYLSGLNFEEVVEKKKVKLYRHLVKSKGSGYIFITNWSSAQDFTCGESDIILKIEEKEVEL